MAIQDNDRIGSERYNPERIAGMLDSATSGNSSLAARETAEILRQAWRAMEPGQFKEFLETIERKERKGGWFSSGGGNDIEEINMNDDGEVESILISREGRPLGIHLDGWWMDSGEIVTRDDTPGRSDRETRVSGDMEITIESKQPFENVEEEDGSKLERDEMGRPLKVRLASGAELSYEWDNSLRFPRDIFLKTRDEFDREVIVKFHRYPEEISQDPDQIPRRVNSAMIGLLGFGHNPGNITYGITAVRDRAEVESSQEGIGGFVNIGPIGGIGPGAPLGSRVFVDIKPDGRLELKEAAWYGAGPRASVLFELDGSTLITDREKRRYRRSADGKSVSIEL